MANLSFREKSVLEELFEMKSGFVLDFTNNSFANFIGEITNFDIYEKQSYIGYPSKAKKLRHLWDVEEDWLVGKVLEELLKYSRDYYSKHGKLDEYKDRKISDMLLVSSRLKGSDAEVALPEKNDDNLNILLEDINNALLRNKPELALDRLHAYSTKVIRQICERHGIDIANDKGNNYPLHSLVGMLKKKYEQDEMFQSSFTLLAIKNSISLFDKYNEIRNDQSFAHDNVILNNVEATFAIRIISAVLCFLDDVETLRIDMNEEYAEKCLEDEIPF